jgi:hypothetical protein
MESRIFNPRAMKIISKNRYKTQVIVNLCALCVSAGFHFYRSSTWSCGAPIKRGKLAPLTLILSPRQLALWGKDTYWAGKRE